MSGRKAIPYDANSNRLTKTTPWGTLDYDYDNENRLVYSGQEESGTTFSYDANGNLLSKQNAYKTEQYAYNGLNRMAQSVVTDTVENTQTTSYYGYDAFGRRTLVQDAGFAAMRTLYDGQSFDIIRENEVFGETTRAPTLVIGEDVTDSQNTNKHSRFTGTKTSLYANGENVGVNRYSSADGEGGRAYFGTDILGSVRSATTDTGAIEDRYEYDAFGTPYKGDFSNGLNGGYTGKPYDATTGLYNYGFRDYSPETARFTTVDPIRDGNNWFSYVVNDPVNYVDLWGLAPHNMSAADRKAYMDKVSGFLGYIFKSKDHKDNKTMGIPDLYDCADVVTFIYNAGMKETSIENGGAGLLFAGGVLLGKRGIAVIHSTDFFPNQTKNVTFYTVKDENGNTKKDEHGKDVNVKDFNNSHVEVGTIMVWEGPGVSNDEGWYGHVATVVGVTRDDKGNVTNIDIIHGSTGGFQTIVEPIENQADLNEYLGTFHGFAEMGENSTTPLKNK